MGLVVGMLLGAGAFCVWWSCWTPAVRQKTSGPRPSERIQDLLTQAGVESVSVRSLLLTCAGAGATIFVLAFAVSASAPIAACFAAMATWAPLALVRARARQRRATLRELWPDVVDNLSSGVRAGLSLPEALSQIGERGPEPLRPAFRYFAEDYRASGRFAEALDRLKERLADPVADRIVESLRITREVGGSDLGRLLRTLSAFLREDARTRSELEARQSWTVNGARLAVAAPWMVLALLASRPEAVSAYNRGTGMIVLAVGAGLSVLAYRLMVRIGRLPEELRVLR